MRNNVYSTDKKYKEYSFILFVMLIFPQILHRENIDLREVNTTSSFAAIQREREIGREYYKKSLKMCD